jgi:phage-related protein
MPVPNKAIVWFQAEIRSPPFSLEGRREAGRLLRDLQEGEKLSLPDSRPMPIIGLRCHELRVWDSQARLYWRIVYRIDKDAIIIAHVFAKKTQVTPQQVISTCKRRFKAYDAMEE